MGLIGRYLDTMPDADRERVLTQEMRPGQYWATRSERLQDAAPSLGPCLVGTAEDVDRRVSNGEGVGYLRAQAFCGIGIVWSSVESRYDALCKRLGTPRANAMIRDRLLTGQRVATEPNVVTHKRGAM